MSNPHRVRLAYAPLAEAGRLLPSASRPRLGADRTPRVACSISANGKRVRKPAPYVWGKSSAPLDHDLEWPWSSAQCLPLPRRLSSGKGLDAGRAWAADVEAARRGRSHVADGEIGPAPRVSTALTAGEFRLAARSALLAPPVRGFQVEPPIRRRPHKSTTLIDVRLASTKRRKADIS